MKKDRDGIQSQLGTRRLIDEARRLLGTGRNEEAESILQGLVSANPRELEALVALGIIAAESGKSGLAITRMHHVLEMSPNCVPALSCLGHLLLQANRIDEAKQRAEQAALLEPRNAGAIVTLARCLVAQGAHSIAIPYFLRAIELSPNNPNTIFELADALLAVGREHEAATALRKAVLLAPNPTSLLKLARLEHSLGRIEDAEKYCQRALRKDPNSLPTHVLMGRIFSDQHRPEEAENHWKKATELSTRPGYINLEKAVSFASIGQFDDAFAELNRSIEANPSQGPAYQELVFARKVVSGDLPLVRQMEDVLAQGSLPQNEQVNLLYALGKSFDNLGDYGRAIDYFDRANHLKWTIQGCSQFDRAAFTSLIDASIGLFSREFFASWKQFRSDSSLPLQVVGMMRSGTTLVEQMLACHPKIGGAGELHYWGENDPSMVDYSRRQVDSSRLRACAKEYVDLLTSAASDFPQVIDKNPANLLVLGSFHLAFPNARMIHTQRNPIDTAISIWTTPMSTTAPFVNDRANIVYAYKEYMRLMDHWREVLPPDRFLEVVYEDLVSTPDAAARRIVAFCGLEWDESCLHPELNSRRVNTPSFWQVRQPIYKTSTERWRNYEPWLGAFEDLRGLA